MGHKNLSERDYERLDEQLSGLENVIGLGDHGPKGRPVAVVTKKVDAKDLPPNQLVENNIPDDVRRSLPAGVGVMEIGDARAEREPGDHTFDSAAASESEPPRQRSDSSPQKRSARGGERGGLRIADTESTMPYETVPSGAEEQPSGKQWVGTGGPIARVTKPNAPLANWADGIVRDRLVRLSNHHVYVGEAGYNPDNKRGVLQPYAGRRVGSVVGDVPIENYIPVDVAARTISVEDGWGVAGLTDAKTGETPEDGIRLGTDLPPIDELGKGVFRDVGPGLVGTTVVKSGRTTDVTTGDIKATGVRVRVNYEDGAYVIDDCLIADPMTESGDSGSPVYIVDTPSGGDVAGRRYRGTPTEDRRGDLVALEFAGSDRASVFCEIEQVEKALGVEIIDEWDPERSPAESEGDLPIESPPDPVETPSEPKPEPEPEEPEQPDQPEQPSGPNVPGVPGDTPNSPGQPRGPPTPGPGPKAPDKPRGPRPDRPGRRVARGRTENPGLPRPFDVIDLTQAENSHVVEKEYHVAVEEWLRSNFPRVWHERYFTFQRRDGSRGWRYADFVVNTAPDDATTDADEGLFYTIEVESEFKFEAIGQTLTYAGLLRREGATNVSPLVILPDGGREQTELDILREQVPHVEFPAEFDEP